MTGEIVVLGLLALLAATLFYLVAMLLCVVICGFIDWVSGL